MTRLSIDCDQCAVRGLACSDCIVSALLGVPDELTFDDAEQAAIDALAASGMVPPLRLVPKPATPDPRERRTPYRLYG
jgi:hypothetical protein